MSFTMASASWTAVNRGSLSAHRRQPRLRRLTPQPSLLAPQPPAPWVVPAAGHHDSDASAPLLDTAGGMIGRRTSGDGEEAQEAQQLMPEASREGEAEESGSDSEPDSSDSSSSSSSSSSCDEEEQGTCPNAAATRQLKLQERQAAAAAGQVPTATTEEGLAVQRDLQARMDADRKAAKQQRKQAERAAKELQKKAEKAAKAQRKEEKRGRKVAAMAVAAAEAEAAANPGRHSPSELPYPRAAVAQLEGEEEALEEGEQAGGKPLSWLLGQLLR